MTAAIHIAADGTAEVSFAFSYSAVEEIKARIPYHSRAWDPDRKIWTISAGPFIHVAIDILVDIFGTHDVHIADDRAGRQSTHGAPSIDMAYRTLHLQSTAPPQLVQAAYKTLARLSHPDTGGNTAQMQALNAAFDSLRDRPAP